MGSVSIPGWSTTSPRSMSAPFIQPDPTPCRNLLPRVKTGPSRSRRFPHHHQHPDRCGAERHWLAGQEPGEARGGKDRHERRQPGCLVYRLHPGSYLRVWVGYDDMMPWERTRPAAGPHARYSWTSCRRRQDRPVHDFQIPEGIVFAKVDTKTEARHRESQDVRFECFKAEGLPPTEQSTIDDLMLKEVY